MCVQQCVAESHSVIDLEDCPCLFLQGVCSAGPLIYPFAAQASWSSLTLCSYPSASSLPRLSWKEEPVSEFASSPRIGNVAFLLQHSPGFLYSEERSLHHRVMARKSCAHFTLLRLVDERFIWTRQGMAPSLRFCSYVRV